MTNQEIIDFVRACQKEAEEAYTDARILWKECWDVANCVHDASYDLKEDWQAKVFIPEAGPAIQKATNLIRRVLISTNRFYDLKGGGDQVPQEYIEGQKAAIDYHIERMVGDKTREDVPLVNVIMEAIESGFTFGLWILKSWWVPRTRRRVEMNQGGWTESGRSGGMSWEWPGIEEVLSPSSGLCAKIINPNQFWFDPEHDFYIEDSFITLPKLMRLAEEEGSPYDMAQIRLVASDDSSGSEYDTDNEEILDDLGLRRSSNKYRKHIHIREFWGDLTDEKGRIVTENARIVIANGKYVLNPDNMENPYWHGRPPYIVGGPIRALFRKEGKSLIRDILSLQRALNNMTNMSLDGLMWKLLKLIWLNVNAVHDPQQAKSPRPGEPILTKTSEPPMGEVPFSDMPPGALQETDFLRRAMQNVHGVTEFISPAHPIRRDVTATEFARSASESNAHFEAIAREIEEKLIEPGIDMVRWLMIQFWRDFEDPALQQIAQKYRLPWAMAVNDEQRIQFMLGMVRVESRGISSYFERQERLKQLVNFLEITGKVPEFKQRLKLRNILDRLLREMDLGDSADLVITKEEEMELQQREQAAAMNQGQPPQLEQMEGLLAMLPPETAQAVLQALAQAGGGQPYGPQ